MQQLLVPLLLSLILTTTCIMQTHYRRFWHPLESVRDYHLFLNDTQSYLVYTRIKTSEEGDVLLKLLSPEVLGLKDALNLLLVRDTHYLIFYFTTVKEFRLCYHTYAMMNATPQIWTHITVTAGPGGPTVSKREVNNILSHDFTQNRVLAVSWSAPNHYVPVMKYEKAQIDAMASIMDKRKDDEVVVLVFDAFILSQTPEVADWLPAHLNQMACLIQLRDYSMDTYVDIGNLVNFIDNTTVWPIFLDLPIYMHLDVLLTSVRLNNSKPTSRTVGGSGYSARKGVLVIFAAFVIIEVLINL